MAEYEYRPDFCWLCLRDIAPEAPIVIVDEVAGAPHYYHLSCFLKEPMRVASMHGYPKTSQGGK